MASLQCALRIRNAQCRALGILSAYSSAPSLGSFSQEMSFGPLIFERYFQLALSWILEWRNANLVKVNQILINHSIASVATSDSISCSRDR